MVRRDGQTVPGGSTDQIQPMQMWLQGVVYSLPYLALPSMVDGSIGERHASRGPTRWVRVVGVRCQSHGCQRPAIRSEGACIYIKVDWMEFVVSLGFWNWAANPPKARLSYM